MSSTHIELIRLKHELCEKYEIAIGEELDSKPSGQKAKIWQQHRLKEMMENIAKINTELDRLYTDEDSLLLDELNNIRATGLTSYYDKLNKTREYYQMFPALESQSINSDIVVLNTDVKFSGEEIFGKYLDLNELYLQFSNIARQAGIEQDYTQYLDRFNTFFYLPESVKSSKQYSEYLDRLWQYLFHFFKRVHPLVEFSGILNELTSDFQLKLKNGEIHLSGGGSTSKPPKEPMPLRLGMFNSPEELEVLGKDRLKEALEAIGLKCGGTVRERALRLWSVRGKKVEDYPVQLRSRDTKRRDHSDDVTTIGDWEHHAIWKEYKVIYICDLMANIVTATQRHAEKQQTRTIEEKEAEMREEEFGVLPVARGAAEDAANEDDDEGPIYNPLNLPLGWDGKPIPFWLYKLHGLGVEYKCEICGNQSYWGRKAFDRHFQEWKHAHGMRCLGIPNTKHFHDITSIEDALHLYSKIQASIHSEQFTTDADEEFEDTEGNILNRRTYEDLARQGLL